MKTITLQEFGADATGAKDCTQAIHEAVRLLAPGDTLLGTPGAVYRVKDNLTIAGGVGLTIDFRRAAIHSPSHRLLYLEDCRKTRLVNLDVGHTDENRFAGIVMRNCDDCEASAVNKIGTTGSSFAMQFCVGCRFRRIANVGGGRIGFLLHLCNDCEVVECSVSHGEYLYGFQVKGGHRNRIVDCRSSDLACDVAFRDRGDAPWEPSASDSKALPYPFPDKAWSEPDIRRASYGTVFQGCRVERLKGVAFAAQEARGTAILDSHVADASKQAVVFTRTHDGEEANFVLNRFHFARLGKTAIVAQSLHSDPLEGVIVGEGEFEDCPSPHLEARHARVEFP